MDSKKAFVSAADSCKDMVDSCQDLTDSCKQVVDSCKQVVDSCMDLADWCKQLEAMAAHLLYSWEQFKVHQAAATLSPSTTTTSPPTAPEHDPPPTTIMAAATTTTSPPTVPVATPARPEEAPANIELAMDSPHKLSVVPKLAMSASATCSTKCPDFLPKQCKVTSVVLAATDIFSMVQKAAVLPASCTPTVSSFQSIDGPAGVPVLAAGVLVAAIRVPPHPPDLHVLVQEDCDAIKVMEAYLLGDNACLRVPEQEKATLDSVLLQLLGVASGLSESGSIHQKEGDEERPMPWPSFVCYWPTTISLKPCQTSQGITLKLVIGHMHKVRGCPVSMYALPICSDGSGSCFQCWFSGSLKRVLQCLAFLPSINPAICPPWRPPDRPTYQAMIPCIQTAAALLNVSGVLLCDLAHFQWEITWPPPRGFCAILSLWEAYFSQLRQMCSGQFWLIRKKCAAEFWAKPACASNWKSAFQLCWNLQADTYRKQYGTYPAALATMYITLVAVLKSTNCVVQFLMSWDPGITECFVGLLYYPSNTIEVCTSVCRAAVVQQYLNYDQLNSLASYTTQNCTTLFLVWLENLIGGSHQTAVEVGLTTSKYFSSLKLCVKSKVEINGVTILWVELHVYSTCVWLSFTWNPGLHTWLWCCCTMHEIQAPNTIYGSELLEQSSHATGTLVLTSVDLMSDGPAPEANENGLEFSISNSEFYFLLSTRPGYHLHGSAESYFADFQWIIAWYPYFGWFVFGFRNEHILLTSSVVYPKNWQRMNLVWHIAWSFHLSSTVPHMSYQLSHFTSGDVGSFLLGALIWSMADVRINLHNYMLFHWDCMQEQTSGGSSLRFSACSLKLALN